MHSVSSLTTDRLELISATPESLRAAANDLPRLATLLNATIPTDWPHEFLDDALIPMAELMEKEAIDGVERGIFTFWFVLLRQPRTLIGTAGFKAPPAQTTTAPSGSANQAAAHVEIEAGRADIGYGLVKSHQRKGYAREAVRRLLQAAFEHPLVTTVVGETLEDLHASIRVMEACGFHRVSTGGTGYGGEENVIRYDLPRADWERQRS